MTVSNTFTEVFADLVFYAKSVNLQESILSTEKNKAAQQTSQSYINTFRHVILSNA
jgi:hypothetical protein